MKKHPPAVLVGIPQGQTLEGSLIGISSAGLVSTRHVGLDHEYGRANLLSKFILKINDE
jgi:hypothetical protein